ncbi:NAD(P)H-binding protein (plasmid) [Pseudonocardia broussonetiae]|uniref:NAD(P)H-binding protein n=1 Tax=Pseudonocardia broussonetiae TaxID=2736640 RepID=A0A6M6JVY3_9PSEU|nr:NAD(P)H-binding protein [Pseudonocardia broussonetiae]
MRVGVLGGTGRTGRLVVAEFVRRGHEVAALARDPATAGLGPGVRPGAPSGATASAGSATSTRPDVGTSRSR